MYTPSEKELAEMWFKKECSPNNIIFWYKELPYNMELRYFPDNENKWEYNDLDYKFIYPESREEIECFIKLVTIK